MILNKIIEKKTEEVASAKKKLPLSGLKEKVGSGTGQPGFFKKAISRKGHINLIAEVKKSSPSKGIIRGDFDPVHIGMSYQSAGASAISVLTDERFFDGKLKYIKMIKERVSLPILRKEFIIDEYQIYESSVAGADAILLIARILTKDELVHFVSLSKDLGLDTLVEVESEEDVEKADFSHASIIGINNRDLGTFHVDFSKTERLIRLIPENKTIVSESGIKTYEEVMFLKSLGVNAVLIGETFMREQNIAAKVREVMADEL
ncbi:MAG: indole-3-glycerol phosphate synthase TrpC [Candidatus Omnitrophica bacterium]|nr:indole-3-glycerol phosphate synthase TrpC [Candidatus Omnitrophota bacterium]